MSALVKMLTLAEVAAKLSTPVETVRYWVHAGKLPAYKPGRHQLVKESDLVAFVDGSAVGAAKPVVRAKKRASGGK